MKTLVISCSGKRDGNSERLAQGFAAGCREAGAQAEVVCLSELEVRGCQGCNACQVSNRCAIDDGMQRIYPLFLECDSVAFVTPVYFWGMSSQMKAVIDRLYALGAPSDKGYFAYPRKRCAIIASAADTEKHFWVFESVRQYWQRLTTYLRWESLGELYVGSCGGTKAPRRLENTDGEQRAREFGIQYIRQCS